MTRLCTVKSKLPVLRGVNTMPLPKYRYPVGKFEEPEVITKDDIKAYTNTLRELPNVLRLALKDVTDEQLDTPYRNYGWNIRQVIHHLADSHMNSFCRFKLALTETNPTIKPYIESLWADMPDAKVLPIEPSLGIIEGVHFRWVHLLSGLHSSDYSRIYTHPEHNKIFRLDTTLAMYAWHSRHHFGHVNNVVKSEYTLE